IGSELSSGGSTTTLTGSGTVLMGTSGMNYVLAPGTLINQNNTIQGAGTILLGGADGTLDNRGTVNANVNGGILGVTPGPAAVTNSGILEASNGGTLQLLQGAYVNTGGTIQAGAGSAVQLDGATITAGTLTTIGNGLIETIGGGATLNGLANAGTFLISDKTVTAISVTINNTGTITLGSVGDNTFLKISGSATLAGTGTVVLGTGGPNYIEGASTGKEMLINQSTVQGVGFIGNGLLTLDNQGTIDANGGGTLIVQ